jgi:hypothetical protein
LLISFGKTGKNAVDRHASFDALYSACFFPVNDQLPDLTSQKMRQRFDSQARQLKLLALSTVCRRTADTPICPRRAPGASYKLVV